MADEAKIAVFGSESNYSVFVQRVRISLTEKKIPYELVRVDIKNKPQELLDANPIHKKVPTIIHNGKAVPESLVILEYLEDAFPEQVPLMPKDAYEKSKVRFWVDYIYKTISAIAPGLRAKAGSPEQEANFNLIVTFLKTLDGAITAYSADGPFFTGEKFGLIDVALAPLCSHIGTLGAFAGSPLPGPDELPRFYRWVEVAKVHPSVSSIIPSPEEALESTKKKFQSLAVSEPVAAK